MDLYHPIELPGLTIPGNLFLAPLAGFTDTAFRKTCINAGADLTFSEMVSCEGIIRENRKTTDLMKRAKGENLFAIQIFSGKPDAAEDSIAPLLKYKPSIIDLNCGCPVPKVIKNGAGSALTRDPKALEAVVKAIKRGLEKAGSQIPVSVKIRSGWNEEEITYREAALRAVDAGAAMVSIHPRTRVQGYSGKADWEKIARLKEELTVPLIGSGDLLTPEDVKNMLEQTGCDGVMFARGAIGNPFIFSRSKQYITTGIIPPDTTAEERLTVAEQHLNQAVADMGDPRACREMKKHLCSYTKGIPGGASLRNELVHAQSSDDYPTLFQAFLEDRAQRIKAAGYDS